MHERDGSERSPIPEPRSPEGSRAHVRGSRSKLFAACLAATAVSLAAAWLAGEPRGGAVAASIMLAFSGALTGRRRAQTTGRPADARARQPVDHLALLRVTSFAGTAMILTCFVGMLGSLVGGDEGGLAYALVTVVGGLVYLIGALVVRPRG